MLLRFRARNYRSIWESQELSLVASELTDRDDLLQQATSDHRALRVAVIYGANASGKSNVLEALRFMRLMVLSSHSEGRPDGGVPVTRFLLDNDSKDVPTSLDIDFVLEGTRYHYGFDANEKEFLAEWLYAFPSGRRQILFHREKQIFEFGRNLKGRNKVISDLTRSNSLFLSAAVQNDHDELTRITRFFRHMRGEDKASIHGVVPAHELAKEGLDGRVIDFLGKIGTGITGYRKKESDAPEEVLFVHRELTAAFQKISSVSIESPFSADGKVAGIELAHKSRSGDETYLDFSQESDGTRRLISLLGQVYRALSRGSVFYVDELNAHLHTQACEALVALFSIKELNPNGAQLIATTHDTNLLRSSYLRRDQIWFTEKDNGGATHLYPLTDIRTRKEDNIEKGYLQGRYGAIPFAGSVESLFS